MPPQVQSRPATTDPLSASRVGVDKFPPAQHDPMHPSSCDSRAKSNLQHREALRLALGSILAPKRPSVSGSRSSSGTASPAHSFSGSSGTYTPVTPPTAPFSPSAEASHTQEYTYSRHHMPLSHYHPMHAPSKLGRAEPHSDPSSGDTNSASLPSSPLLIPHPVGPPHPLFRSRSNNPSTPPSSRTSPRLAPSSPPSTAVTESADLGALAPRSILPEATTSNVDGGEAASVEEPSTRVSSVADPGAVIKPVATSPQHDDSHTQHDSIERSYGSGGPGTPKAKFIETLRSKSAWDALIHGSFS